MGKISLEGLEFFAYHGFYEEERKIGQNSAIVFSRNPMGINVDTVKQGNKGCWDNKIFKALGIPHKAVQNKYYK